MNGSPGFEKELRDRLVALAEPAPAVTGAVITAVRRGALRRRRRVQAVTAAALLLAALGSGAVAGRVVTDAKPPPADTSAVAAHELLGWPPRMSNADGPDTGLITKAWTGRHTAVRVLHVGTPSPGTRIAVLEGRAETGEARLAVLTKGTGDWQLRLDTAGFDSPPEHLFVVLDAAEGPSTVLALSAPGRLQGRINNVGGQPVAFLTTDSAEYFAVPKGTAESLRLYVSRSSLDEMGEWTLDRWAAQGPPDARVTLIIPGVRVR